MTVYTFVDKYRIYCRKAEDLTYVLVRSYDKIGIVYGG